MSANGTRTDSAWVPSMRWPKIQPIPPTVWQCEGMPRWQYSHRPHLVMAGTSTRSPTREAVDRLADLGDGADRLVPKDAAVGDRGHVTMENVQVGAAYGGGVDPDHDVGRFGDAASGTSSQAFRPGP